MQTSRRTNRKSGKGRREVCYPPPFSANIAFSHKYRFTGGGNGLALTGALLYGAAGGVATSSTQITSFINTLKIDRISIWTPYQTATIAPSCSIEWDGAANAFGCSKEVSCSAVSPDCPAHVSGRPPPGSQASFWHTVTDSTITLATIYCGAQSIVEIDLKLVIFDKEAGVSPYVTTVVGSATIGQTYYLALDGVSTHTLVPVGLTTIV